MDTSKEYAIMCEAIPELQEKPILDSALFYAQKWKNRTEPADYIDHTGLESWYYDVRIQLSDEAKTLWSTLDRYLQKVIWLPRQDQLQQIYFDHLTVKEKEQGKEIDCKHIFSLFTMLSVIADFAMNLVHDGDHKWVDSIEKIWLLFIMSRIHNKKWNQESKTWETERI